MRCLLAAVPLAAAILLLPLAGPLAGPRTASSGGLRLGAQPVLAASPAPSDASGDTRSPGEGPGLVGRPLQAILAVVAVAVLSALLTLTYVRLTDRRGRSGRRN